MQWDGTWTQIELTDRGQWRRSNQFGIADVTIDGRAVRVELFTYRGRRTFARDDAGRWYELIKTK